MLRRPMVSPVLVGSLWVKAKAARILAMLVLNLLPLPLALTMVVRWSLQRGPVRHAQLMNIATTMCVLRIATWLVALPVKANRMEPILPKTTVPVAIALLNITRPMDQSCAHNTLPEVRQRQKPRALLITNHLSTEAIIKIIRVGMYAQGAVV